MADLHILRKHALGFSKARKLAFDWAEQVEKEFGMECIYEEGKSADKVRFKRSGVHGELQVTKDKFELAAKLGFLLGAFRDRIEREIVKMLDSMLPLDGAQAHEGPHRDLRSAAVGRAGNPDEHLDAQQSAWVLRTNQCFARRRGFGAGRTGRLSPGKRHGNIRHRPGHAGILVESQ